MGTTSLRRNRFFGSHSKLQFNSNIVLRSQANLRRLLDNVANGTVEKVNKLCTRGLDPNFHDPDSGETPLTLSATLKSPNKMIIALVNGGALVDFRTKDGRTALHRAVERNNLEALKVRFTSRARLNESAFHSQSCCATTFAPFYDYWRPLYQRLANTNLSWESRHEFRKI